MLRLCSYFVYKINSWKEFITPNMSTIGAFLTLSKHLYPAPNCQKCSKFAQIQCDEFILWVNFTQQIWEKSKYFWQSPKFHILYPKFGSCQKCSDCAHILFIKSTHEKNSSHQIWAQSEHFWHCPKICIQLQIVKSAPNLLKFNVMNSFSELISHNKYEKNQSIFDNVQNFTFYIHNFGSCQK